MSRTCGESGTLTNFQKRKRKPVGNVPSWAIFGEDISYDPQTFSNLARTLHNTRESTCAKIFCVQEHGYSPALCKLPHVRVFFAIH